MIRYLSSFRGWAEAANNRLAESAGWARQIRFVHDGNCEISVERVVLSPAGDDSFQNTWNELYQLGYGRSDRKYLVFRDANQLCGIAYVSNDDRPSPNNKNDNTTGYATVDNGCWGNMAEFHELGHSWGAVQKSAPNSEGNFHIGDTADVLYWIVNPRGCFDCSKDNYFSVAPEAGSYLATHWNIANSGFLIGADSGGGSPNQPQQPPPVDNPSQQTLNCPDFPRYARLPPKCMARRLPCHQESKQSILIRIMTPAKLITMK